MKTKTISTLLLSAVILSVAGTFAFAEKSATLEWLKGTDSIPNYHNESTKGAIPPVVPGMTKDTAPAATTTVTKSTATAPAVTAPAAVPEKPSLLSKMGKDLKDNKMDYTIAGAAGALTGYFLMGSVLAGAVLGLGIFVLFLLLLRNW